MSSTSTRRAGFARQPSLLLFLLPSTMTLRPVPPYYAYQASSYPASPPGTALNGVSSGRAKARGRAEPMSELGPSRGGSSGRAETSMGRAEAPRVAARRLARDDAVRCVVLLRGPAQPHGRVEFRCCRGTERLAWRGEARADPSRESLLATSRCSPRVAARRESLLAASYCLPQVAARQKSLLAKSRCSSRLAAHQKSLLA